MARLPSPAAWSRIHAALAVTWALLLVPSLLWWRDSLIWVIAMSCYANCAGSMASWMAARADANSPTCEQLDRLERKVESISHRITSKR